MFHYPLENVQIKKVMIKVTDNCSNRQNIIVLLLKLQMRKIPLLISYRKNNCNDNCIISNAIPNPDIYIHII